MVGPKRKLGKAFADKDDRYNNIVSRVKPERQLRIRRVKRATLFTYDDRVQDFIGWAGRRRKSLLTATAVDRSMSVYFNELFCDGEGINFASYTLFGWIALKMLPDKPERDLLPLARAALSAWRGLRPQKARVGVPPVVINGFVSFCLKLGEVQAAVAALIQHDLYARPSEILQLCGRDLVTPVKSLSGQWGVVLGNSDFDEQTKTGTTDDVVLADSSHRPWCNKLLQHISRGRLHLNSKIFNMTLAQYEDLCRKFSKHYHLQSGIFTPHTVRHSGPSYDAIHQLRSLPEIQQRGRWSCPGSVARYKRPGRLLLQASRLPPAFQSSGAFDLASSLTDIFSTSWVKISPVEH